MNLYTDEQIARMKARLTATTTTIVYAVVHVNDEKPIPEVKIMEDITKETAARLQLIREAGTIVVIYDLGFEPEDKSIEEAVFKAKEDIYKKMEAAGL